MIEIELEPATTKLCECCGTETVSLTRFVLQDGSAHAVYYAQYSRGHESERINGLVSLGEWGESATPDERLAFPFQLWATEDNYNVALVDASASPWSHVTYLGRILDRQEALSHPWCKEVFHITDHMVSDDPEVKAFLNGVPSGGA
jgi:hypothetical protein